MAKGMDRFEKVYSQGTLEGMEIWVDKETGVNYLYHFAGYAGSLTPLLDENGKPIVSNVSATQEQVFDKLPKGANR